MLPVFVMLMADAVDGLAGVAFDTGDARQMETIYTEGTVAMGERFLWGL